MNVDLNKNQENNEFGHVIGPQYVRPLRVSSRFEGKSLDEYRIDGIESYKSSWSFSRAEPLCQRQSWYFGGPASYGADHPEADELTKYISRGKSLNSLPLLVGTLVHNIIAHSLFVWRDYTRAVASPDYKDPVYSAIKESVTNNNLQFEDVIEEAIKRFRTYREVSLSHGATFRDSAQHFRLIEHQFENRFRQMHFDEKFLEAEEKIRNSLTIFYRDIFIPQIIKGSVSPEYWADVELDEDYEVQSVPTFLQEVDGIPVTIYAGIDFSYFHSTENIPIEGDRRLEIYDWKTGAMRLDRNERRLSPFLISKHALQGGIYSHYMMQKHKDLTPADIEAKFVYTSPDASLSLEERTTVIAFDSASLNLVSLQIEDNVRELRKAFTIHDGEITFNQEDFLTHWDDARMSKKGMATICSNCAYAGACQSAPEELQNKAFINE
jgi:hypothetical protein